ncbi:MAG: hypothetical protein AB7V42_13950 [Thermoleophilia bacterium]
MIDRLIGAALMLLGAALGALPAFAWFEAPAPRAPVSATGLAAAGELWLLPVLGALIVLAGAGLLAAGPGSEAPAARGWGAVAAVAAALAMAWSLRVATDPPVALVARSPGGGATELPLTVSLEPAAVIAPVLAGVILAAALAVIWRGRRG